MFFRNVVGGVISKSSAVLQSLDERLNAEQEEADAYADFADLDDAARARFDQLVKTNKRLERMVVTLEQSLGDEQRVASETSAKLALAAGARVGDRDTIDGLVDEYSKLSREAAGQAERDAATIADLLNKSEEQAMKLRLYERQIVSLSDAQSQEVRAFVGAGGAPDTARLFAALQGARAQNFELELEVEAAKRLAAPGPVDERCRPRRSGARARHGWLGSSSSATR
ncbi:hypothetical protein M885DRAFT_608172 [Pelagophyceae sp. CCMP2097]|nr:hypothetical protein M885DRAFT_608172 [Pelagophyceae sp. CCMP2097]